MNNFPRFKDFVISTFESTEFDKAWVEMGPDIPDLPNEGVILTRYGGPGLDTGEGIIDQRSWQVRTIGRQNQPAYAEAMADELDLAMVSHYSRRVGGVWVSNIQRVGGAPAALMIDDSDRTHFVCSYVVSVELAPSN